MLIIKPFNIIQCYKIQWTVSKHLLPGEQRNNWNRQPSETLPNKRQITACDLAWGYMHSQSRFFLWALFHDPGMVPLSPYHAARRLWVQFLESGQQTQTHGRWDHMPGWLAGKSRRNGGFNGKIILKIGDYPMPRLSTAGYHSAFLRVMFIHLIYLLSMSRIVIGVARSKHILF